jgi:hypothetical protein
MVFAGSSPKARSMKLARRSSKPPGIREGYLCRNESDPLNPARIAVKIASDADVMALISQSTQKYRLLTKLSSSNMGATTTSGVRQELFELFAHFEGKPAVSSEVPAVESAAHKPRNQVAAFVLVYA